jgi:hypothetical protein
MFAVLAGILLVLSLNGLAVAAPNESVLSIAITQIQIRPDAGPPETSVDVTDRDQPSGSHVGD